MEIKTSKEITKWICSLDEEEETIEEGDNFDYTPYNKAQNQEWITIEDVREIVRAVIWRIAQDEGGQVLHYNDWVDDNWKELLNTPTIELLKEARLKKNENR